MAHQSFSGSVAPSSPDISGPSQPRLGFWPCASRGARETRGRAHRHTHSPEHAEETETEAGRVESRRTITQTQT
eukprot:4661787-Pleurochrysis_carterae.AAC.1